MADEDLTEMERIELAEKGVGVREITEDPKPRQAAVKSPAKKGEE